MADETDKQDKPFAGQNPYTDPPPPGRRRFYEDPKPANAASEQQVMQGRGAPPPYPGDQVFPRAWEPERYPDQKSAERPPDTAQPSLAESMGSGLTVSQLLALPKDQQEQILEQMRHRRDNPHEPFAEAPAKPAPKPAEEDEAKTQEASGGGKAESQHEGAPASRTAKPNPQQGSGEGVQRMAPAAPGTMIAGETPREPDSERRGPPEPREQRQRQPKRQEDDPGEPPYDEP